MIVKGLKHVKELKTITVKSGGRHSRMGLCLTAFGGMTFEAKGCYNLEYLEEGIDI
jgi:hypothetical protein